MAELASGRVIGLPGRIVVWQVLCGTAIFVVMMMLAVGHRGPEVAKPM